MLTCSCGREFATNAALRQHQADKGTCVGTATTAKSKNPHHNRGKKDAWLWKHVRRTPTIHRIKYDATQPSNAPVTSSSGSELVCSYNWRTGKDMKELHIPGSAAVWHDITLPVTLPVDQGVYFVDQNAALAPESPFEPMFRATTVMNPAFRFDNIDVVTNRNSLRKILDFSAGRRQDSFRLNLHLIHRTLVIERCEKNVRQLVNGSRDPGWGKIFEQRSTQYPSGLEDSAAHHRSLQYNLGDLKCVVQFEVDACYDKESKANDGLNALSSALDELSIKDSASGKIAAATSPGQIAPMDQKTAAEIKTETKRKPLRQRLPQLWFGRTPWLIAGCHTQGTFTECRITDASAHFSEWEHGKQDALRKLVTVLGQLRESVQKNGGRHCVAICEKKEGLQVIEVFSSNAAKMAVPSSLKDRLWDATTAEPLIGA